MQWDGQDAALGHSAAAAPPPLPAPDLVGLTACNEGSQHGGSAAKEHLAALAAAGEGTGAGLPPAKRVKLELPSNLAAAAAAAVASGDYKQLAAAAAAAGADLSCGCPSPGGKRNTDPLGLQRLASQAAVPALSASRLERELEKALRAFIRIK